MKPEARVVLDSNVLVSALLFSRSIPADCLRKILDRGTLIVSEEILAEYSEVLARPKLDKYVSRFVRDQLLERIAVKAELVLRVEHLSVCRDPKDNKFLEAAKAGNADCIVTGDSDLLALDSFEGVRILDPSSLREPVR